MLSANKLIIHNVMRNIDRIDGRQFEFYTGYLLKLLNYTNIKVTRATGDFGVDVIATSPKGKKIGFQCKHYKHNSTLGYHSVEEAYCGTKYYNLDKGVVIANRPFTKHAKKGADGVGVVLWDRDYLQHLIFKLAQHYYIEEDTNIIQFLSPKQIRVSRNGMSHMFDVIGTAKAKVLKWLIRYATSRLCDAHGSICASQESIAEHIGVTMPTLRAVIKKLKEHNLIITKTNLLILSPMLFYYGNDDEFRKALRQFKFMIKQQKKATNQADAKDLKKVKELQDRIKARHQQKLAKNNN